MSHDQTITTELLEQLVLGQLPADRAWQVEAQVMASPELGRELAELRSALEQLALSEAVAAPQRVKERLMQRIGAIGPFDAARPPILHAGSKAADYAFWVEEASMVEDPANENIFFLPFAENSDGISALVWMRVGAPEETHSNVIERFLVLDGTCEVRFNGTVQTLQPGSFMSIPLHTPHSVKVTSSVPCRIIIQRLAA